MSVSRQLVQPTSHIPWSVDVVRLAPKRLTEGGIIASCTAYGWAAFTTGDGYIHVWQGIPKSLTDPILEPVKSCIKIFLPDLIAQDDVFLAISCPSSSTGTGTGTGNANTNANAIGNGRNNSSNGNTLGISDAIYLYVWHAGWLYLKKLTTKDFLTSNKVRSHNTKTRVELQTQRVSLHRNNSESENKQDNERIWSMTASPGLLVLSSTKGNLYWATVTSVPVGLHVQKVQAPTGFLSRFVFGTGSAADLTTTSGSVGGGESPCHVLPKVLGGTSGTATTTTTTNSSSTAEFLSITLHDQGNGSHIIHWKATVTVGTAHHTSFDLISKNHLDLSSLSHTKVLTSKLSPNGKTLHCIVSGDDDSGINKLFWVQANLDGSIQRKQWINRFAEPSQVEILGLTVSENESAYATFRQLSIPGVTVMAWDPQEQQGIIQEIELPTRAVPNVLPNTMEADTTTHGCALLTTNGLGLRVRYLSRELPSATKRARYSSSSSTKDAAPLSINAALVSHLRSAFWQSYQDPETHRSLPPSLPAANIDVLELTIVTFATELQHKGGDDSGVDTVSSAQNPMEWHRALIKFLQDRGLYRNLSQDCRWQLFSIGQELAVFGYISQFQQQTGAGGGSSLLSNNTFDCKSYGLADWLLQKATGGGSSSSGGVVVVDTALSSHPEWNTFITGVLEVAMEYRDETSTFLYDVLNDPPQPVWLSYPSMQRLIGQQFDRPVDRSNGEILARAALVSYSEHYPSKKEYYSIQCRAITLLRSIDADALAFELSIQYRFFEGLCQISVDHEKQRDGADFALDSLLTSIESKDVLTGYTFSQYVLQWHTDKGYYGHTINYGRHAPKDLDLLMKTDERLSKYKWIPAVRQSFFDQTTEAFLANAEQMSTMSTPSSSSLKDVHWALSMAKLANQLCVSQKDNRQKILDKKLDLVQAQELLEENSETTAPKSPEELVVLALKRISKASAIDVTECVRYATVALAVCNAMEDTTMAIDYTAQVWAEILRLNEEKWTYWLNTETNLASDFLKEEVMTATVFGLLLEECRREDSMSSVTYGRHIEPAVLQKLGADFRPVEFSRLLRSVTMNPTMNQGRSLIAAAY